MAIFCKSQEGEEEELTVPEASVKDKRKGEILLFGLCVGLTCVRFFSFLASILF